MPRQKAEWNPYFFISRKILETHPKRLQDIKQMKIDYKDMSLGIETRFGKNIVRCNSELFDIYCKDGLKGISREQMLKAIEEHIEILQQYVDIVDYAYDVGTRDILNDRIKKKVLIALHQAFEQYHSGQMPAFELMDYPLELSKHDFDARRRLVALTVTREAGLMPYMYQPHKHYYGKIRQRRGVCEGTKGTMRPSQKKNLAYRQEDVGL